MKIFIINFVVIYIIFVIVAIFYFNFPRLQFYLVFLLLLTYYSWERFKDTQSHRSYLITLIPLTISAAVIAITLRYLSNVLDLW